jgi:hypothetical protein
LNAVVGSRQFRAAREGEWQRLEEIIGRCERRSVRVLSDEDLLALPVLYRGALSSLSVARETSLDLELITYLENLCARAYFFVYGVRTSPGSRIVSFFARDWPLAIQSLWRETLASLAITMIGVLAGYLLVANDPGWFSSFVCAGRSTTGPRAAASRSSRPSWSATTARSRSCASRSASPSACQR